MGIWQCNQRHLGKESRECKTCPHYYGIDDKHHAILNEYASQNDRIWIHYDIYNEGEPGLEVSKIPCPMTGHVTITMLRVKPS